MGLLFSKCDFQEKNKKFGHFTILPLIFFLVRRGRKYFYRYNKNQSAISVGKKKDVYYLYIHH